MKNTSLSKLLTSAVKNASIELSPDTIEKLVEYILLLEKWNQAYNLTSVRDPEEMVTRHILDSLLIRPYLHGKRILDVGSGGGLPGIPLALTAPDLEFVLLDSNGKKTRFLTHMVQTLQITNVQVVQERIEKYHPDPCFDTIMSRAFATLAEFVTWSQSLCCPNGRWLAMKGIYPTEEIAALSDEFSTMVYDLSVPGLNAERHLVVVTKNLFCSYTRS